MRIPSSPLPPSEPVRQADKAATASRADGAGQASAATDESRLSPFALVILAGASPSRLESLRDAVAADTYAVPADVLSRRLVEFYLAA
ncbi:MAG: hypothetical protein IPM24_01105 [Bryobacterales bacterium]|jgi:hypothetical protein|nr:hypothetical protein [Bryobacterales bacterium]